MLEPLVSYVNDHLGGASIALQLLEAMRGRHDDTRIGSGPSAVREVGSWLLEKATRLKLGHTGSTDFAMFESLELLVLGMHGKLCLWKALQVASRPDSRLREFDFEELVGRAQQQYDKVESERLHLAQTVLLPSS